jgi:flagellar protein FlgJ
MSIEDASGAGAAKFFADFKNLAALKADAKAQTPASVKAAAKQFESLFTQMMLKSMRAATPTDGDSYFSSDQEKFYQEMFDQQMSVQMSQGKGLGLADMLVQQLMRNGDAAAHGAMAIGAGSSVPTASTSAWPPRSREDFVKQLLPAAQEAGARLGVDAHTLIAHAALETDWGRAVPAGANGTSSFNLFGVKTGSSWSGQRVAADTTEYVSGQAVAKRDNFRSYSSPAESVRDYASLLSGNPRYSAALGTGSNTAAFATALQRGGYATDPNYAAKLTAVARSLKFEQPLPLTGGDAV